MKTLHEQIKSIERELAMRRRVYPRLIHEGRMRVETAQHEIECMESILLTLQKVEQPELL